RSLRLLGQLRQSPRRILDPMPIDVEAGDVLVLEQALLLLLQPVTEPNGSRLPGIESVNVGTYDDRFEQRFALHPASCLPTVRDLVRVTQGSTLRCRTITARQRLVTPVQRGDERLRVRSGSRSAGNATGGARCRQRCGMPLPKWAH